MFRWCESLDTLNLGNADTSNVTDMAEMFRGCKALKSSAIKNLNTSNVTDISEMFDGCESLTTVNLSGFNTAKVTTMYSMFDGCKALTGVDLSSFDTSKVTNMHSMFRGCEALTKLDLTNFNTGSLQVIEEMFKDCTKLKAIYVSVSLWSTASVCAGWDHNVFQGCTALVGLSGTKYNAENVSVEYARPDYPEQPGYLSYYCFDLDQETGVLTLHDMLYQPQLSTLQLNYGSKITSVTALPGTVFPPDSSKMFEDYVKVVSFDLSNADTSNVKNMSYMFRNCASLQTLDLGSFDTRKVTNMACMFAYDSLMTDLNLSSFDTGKVTNMRHMFNGCAMTTLDLSAFSNSSLTNVSYMFYECKNLTTIYASDRWLPDQDFSTDYMFYNCKALVGGNGTQCSGEYSLHDSRARIDEPGKPGYFTRNLLFNLSFRHNCEINEHISMTFAVPKAELAGFNNIRLEVNMEAYTAGASAPTVTKRTINSYSETSIGGITYYSFSITDFDPADIGNILYARVKAEKNSKTYTSQDDRASIGEETACTGRDENLKFSEYNLSLESSIRMNFYVPVANLSDYKNVRVISIKEEFGDSSAKKSYKKRIISPKTVTRNHVQTYSFEFTDIAAKQMGDDIYLAIYAEDNSGNTYIGPVKKYSVKTYADYIVSHNYAAKLKKMVVDMLNYGAQAQQYFKYKTDMLVNADLTAAQSAYGSEGNPTITKINSYTNISGATATFTEFFMTLDNTIQFNAKFKLESTQSDANIKAVMTYKDVKTGTLYTETVTRDKMTKASGVYIAKFSSIAAKDSRQPLTIIIYDGNKQISRTQIHSIESYARIAIDYYHDDQLTSLMNAMMNYIISAEKYFTNT